MLLNDISNYQSKQPKHAWKTFEKEVGNFVLAKYPLNQT